MSKVVVVTGANKGIGLATCRRLLREYGDVRVYLGSRDAGRGRGAVESLVAENGAWEGRVSPLQLDVTDQASVNAAVSEVGSPLFGLINNAGVGPTAGGSVAGTIAVNVEGTERVTRAFLPSIRDGGRVVHVTSASGSSGIASLQGVAGGSPWPEILLSPEVTLEQVFEFCDAAKKAEGRPAGEAAALGFPPSEGSPMWQYNMSKAAENALTLVHARENPRLSVNAVTPGFIDTDLTAPMRGGKPAADFGMKQPDDGAVPVVHVLMSDEVAAQQAGRYYGSDCKRSPMGFYRSPGDPEYDGSRGP